MGLAWGGMQDPLAECFFHYTTREAAFERIVPSRQLRMSPYDRVNDPREAQPWRFIGASFPGESPSESDRHGEAYWRFTAEAHEIWGSAKLLALTIDAPVDAGYEGAAAAFGRGWARARMWDQYAEKHAGVCLMFDRDKLTESIRSSLASQGLAAPYCRPVEYSDDGLHAPLLDLNALAGDDVSARVVRTFVEEHHDELFFLKNTDWQTEFEYRFVVTAPDSDFVFVDYDDALEAVIVGHAFPPWQRAGAVQLCDAMETSARRIIWSNGRPMLSRMTATSHQSGRPK